MLVKLFDLETLSPVLVGLIAPVLVLVLGYAIILQVLNQLALHSLAHNRRGVASALTHAWRLVRASPWSALRATLVDLLLFFLVLFVQGVLESLLPGFIGWVLFCCVVGFAGVTRAGYWARTYTGLGGLATVERESRVVAAAT